MKYKSEIKGLKIRTDIIIVVLIDKIYVYNFSNVKLIDIIDAKSNIRGLCSVNIDGVDGILACPDVE